MRVGSDMARRWYSWLVAVCCATAERELSASSETLWVSIYRYQLGPSSSASAASVERGLSASDGVTRHGQLAAVGTARKFVYVHIPKAAGASFMKDSPAYMAKGDTLVAVPKSYLFLN